MKVRLNGKKIDFNWQAKMLFGYLAYHSNKALSRDHLARVFWPEKQESQPESARRSLNVELNHIRKAIRQQTGMERELIVFDKNCYRLQLDRPMLSDVATFKTICQKIQMLQREHQPVPDELFQQAIQTYSSNFLDDCPEDALNWVEVERQHLGALFEQLADLYSAQLCDKGEYYRATSVCHEILTRDQAHGGDPPPPDVLLWQTRHVQQSGDSNTACFAKSWNESSSLNLRRKPRGFTSK
ncbi:MAG: winged helix-turn-helix domain-containing protein [Lewinellaceae bacterium]|nr:winged helix-turn-helix domain-containing protein [Lewinellaceae bacterium]